MKKIFLFLSSFFFLLHTVYAAPVAPSNIVLDNATSTSLKFSWSWAPDALWYYLYWGTKSWVNGTYENEEITPIEGINYELTGLSPGILYFIALSTVDSSGTESALSQEVSFSTIKSGTSSSGDDFSLKEVKTLSLSELEFTFSRDLEDSPTAKREFIIKSSTGKEISVASTQIGEDKNTLQVFLGQDLEYATSYQVTVLAIKDTTGKTIENGIDALTQFSTPSSFEDMQVELNSAGPEETTQTGTTSENPLPTLTGSVTLLTGETGGKILSWNEVEKHTIIAAKQNDNLPQTGPEHIILLILALLAGGIYFYYTTSLKKS